MRRDRRRISMTGLTVAALFLAAFVSAVFAERIIITNGDFESGNSGFTSDYTYVADSPSRQDELGPEGFYSVGYNANNYHDAFLNAGDHTTGFGQMLIANGSPNTSDIVWQGAPSQDLIIGQTYDFSAWIIDLVGSGAHATLTFKADAEVIGTLTCSEYLTWTRLSGSFTATQARPVLTLTNSQADAGGNDFAVDDLNIYYEGSTTPPTEAVLNTTPAASVSQAAADLGGVITSDGGEAISARGFVYSSIDDKPYIGDDNVIQVPDGSGTGSFSEVIASLSPGTTYYFQAYAVNAQGTAYGGVQSFTTDDADITFADGSAFTPDVMQGGVNQAIGRFQLTADLAGASLTSATVQLSGTRTGLTHFRLWASIDATFESASDTPLDGPESDGASISFSGFSNAISTGGTWYFVTADVAAEATGAVQGAIGNNAGLILDKGTLSGALSNAPLSIGDASLPVDLHAFSALCEGSTVVLTWTTASETDNQGFLLERAVGCVEMLHATSLQWDVIASYETHPELAGQGNSSARYDYTFVDASVEPGQSYGYRLSDVSTSGEVHVYDIIFTALPELPKEAVLEPPFPNPFNPETKIAYQLAESGPVEIVVYDLLGRRVHALVDEVQSAGSYTVYWQGNNRLGEKVATGTYVIVLKTAEGVLTRKVIMMR